MTTADHVLVGVYIAAGVLAGYVGIGVAIGVAILLGRWVESHNRTRRNP
jgi:F0F1-type ATP synthase membrane subunit c/vacuolar-type H+-ATPase subunit K